MRSDEIEEFSNCRGLKLNIRILLHQMKRCITTMAKHPYHKQKRLCDFRLRSCRKQEEGGKVIMITACMILAFYVKKTHAMSGICSCLFKKLFPNATRFQLNRSLSTLQVF